MSQSRFATILSNRVFVLAGVLYIVSVASRTVLEQLAYLPEIYNYNRRLAGALRFVVSELQGLTALPVIGVCLVLALTLRPLISAILLSSESD